MGRDRPKAADGTRPATVNDIHEIARALPGVSVADDGPTVYQVSRRSFLVSATPARTRSTPTRASDTPM